MRARLTTTIVTYALLAGAGAVSFLLPKSVSVPAASAQAMPDVLYLTGLVRDFASTHPDFNVVPATGLGHYAGNVDLALGPDGKPVFAAGGFLVNAEWLDDAGNPIAPHMFGVGGTGAPVPGIVVDYKLYSNGGGLLIDSFDSSLGPYGGANVGDQAVICSNGVGTNVINLADTMVMRDVFCGPGGDPATAIKLNGCTVTGTVGALDAAMPMPALVEPALGPSIGDFTMSGGTFTLSGDLHCNKLALSNGAVLTIDADATILVQQDFTMAGGSQILITNGANVEMYCKKGITLTDAAQVNVLAAKPDQLVIRKEGGGGVDVMKGSDIYALLEAPLATLKVSESDFYGRYVGYVCTLENSGRFHVDAVGAGGALCGTPINDSAGVAGAPSDAAITSAATFDEWYRDVLGVNQSMSHTLVMARDMFGNYSIQDNDFYPADGLLLGNEGDVHNKYFTFALKTSFVYEKCQGQFVEFQGGDGFWLFIDGQMVMDLGGVVPFANQRLDVDRLGLTDGVEYEMQLFYADRHPFVSIFRFTTNMALETRGIPSVTAIFD